MTARETTGREGGAGDSQAENRQFTCAWPSSQLLHQCSDSSSGTFTQKSPLEGLIPFPVGEFTFQDLPEERMASRVSRMCVW